MAHFGKKGHRPLAILGPGPPGDGVEVGREEKERPLCRGMEGLGGGLDSFSEHSGGSYPSTVFRLETLAPPLGPSNEVTWEQGERWPQGGAGDPGLRGCNGAHSGNPVTLEQSLSEDRNSIGKQQDIVEGVLAAQGYPP